jgi:hypothetical protein
MKDMEYQGFVGEVLFPNGSPFRSRPADDVGSFSEPAIDRQARLTYNRWLADFCAQTPGRRSRYERNQRPLTQACACETGVYATSMRHSATMSADDRPISTR